MTLRFGIIGDGRIASHHKKAIEAIGGEVIKIFDPRLPKNNGLVCDCLDSSFFGYVDWVVVTSPTHCHYGHVKQALHNGKRVICEKPYVLPWQPVVDNENVSVVLQLRWADLPKTAESIRIRAVRHPAYFASWKGDPYLTGGLFFDLLIHYVDLARRYNCPLEFEVADNGEQSRFVGDLDIMKLDMPVAYSRMYKDIVFGDRGVRPQEVAELHWLLGRYTERYGAGQSILNKKITIHPKGLI